MRALARCNEIGLGVERNEERAATWRRRAEELENVAPRWRSRRALKKTAIRNAASTASSANVAAACLRRRAEAGDASAACALAWLYVEGAGVERSEEAAARWFERAAQGGNADAARALLRRAETERVAERKDEEAANPVLKSNDRDAIP